ncbi:MAG TPA: hypothetical protein VIY47_15115 [Ignavibacteriaceae bacterium]
MFSVNEKIEIVGFIGETFLATINGVLTTLPINAETKYGIITKIIPGSRPGLEYAYMIKFMNYQYPVEVDEDYITKIDCCPPGC